MALRYRDIQEGAYIAQDSYGVVIIRHITRIGPPSVPSTRKGRASHACHYRSYELPEGYTRLPDICSVKSMVRWADRLATQEEIELLAKVRKPAIWELF